MTIFEEILGLLSGSPELHAYLLACPEQLQTTDYAHIISGAPIALTEKGRLLERLAGGRVWLLCVDLHGRFDRRCSRAF